MRNKPHAGLDRGAFDDVLFDHEARCRRGNGDAFRRLALRGDGVDLSVAQAEQIAGVCAQRARTMSLRGAPASLCALPDAAPRVASKKSCSAL